VESEIVRAEMFWKAELSCRYGLLDRQCIQMWETCVGFKCGKPA